MQRRRNTKGKRHIRTRSNLRSIPILFMLKNKYKSNVLYSIPSVVVLVLLFGLFACFNPTIDVAPSNPVYAAENVSEESIASITLDTNDTIVNVTPGSTGYASKNIGLDIKNVGSYTLTITAPATLSLENDPSSTASSWQYAYGDSESELADMNYIDFNGNAQTLENNNGNIANLSSSKTLSIAAGFGENAKAGHYKAEITLSLTTTPRALITYNITYNANGGTGTLPDTQSATSYDSTYDFTTAPTPSTVKGNLARTGYIFLGWSTSSGTSTTVTNPADSSITLSSSNPNIALYAVWQAHSTIANISNMQQMTPEICEATAIGSSKTLTDIRDSNVYNIRKHEDGRCWMTENLKIMDKNISSTDSNVSSTYHVPASNASEFTTSNNIQAAYLGIDSKKNPTGYYSWCTATAGTCSYAANGRQNMPSSICPKGWKLPTGGTNTNTDFYILFKNMGLSISNNLSSSGSTNWDSTDQTKAQTSPYNFANTDFISNGTYANQNVGMWWSSTSSGASNAFLLALYNNFIGPGTTINSLYIGYAVRCIAEGPKTITTITNMQEMTPEICSRSNIGDSNILTDTRDNNTYRVEKLKDNKCWMTQNLKIMNKTIDSTNSDVPTTYTIPPSDLNQFNADVNTQAAYYNSDNDMGYYSWCTATAGTCNSITNNNAPASICPKGWRLPTGGRDYVKTSDYYNLIVKSILDNDPLYVDQVVNSYTINSSAVANTIQNSPYYFTRTGSAINGHTNGVGTYGYFWSSTAPNDDTNAYYLFLSPGSVTPGTSFNNYRNGYVVRCIAKSFTSSE